ncbi:MAG: hypothetical protein ABSG36_08905 [Acidimicrobiales bacterium]
MAELDRPLTALTGWRTVLRVELVVTRERATVLLGVRRVRAVGVARVTIAGILVTKLSR